jgi:16S rRNA (guanine1516-N2)-methyltransferase
VLNDHTVAIKSDAAAKPKARDLCLLLNAQLLEQGEHSSTPITLDLEDGNMTLILKSQGKPLSFSLDLSPRYRVRGRDTLLRAIGGCDGLVVDMTAGWCTDALHVARAGYDVIAIERNPLIFSMVKHAIDKMNNASSLATKLRIEFGASVDLTSRIQESIDVIYLDPMYPKRPGTAASPKDITVLREIVSLSSIDDGESEQDMFDLAMNLANKRVVVKRPHFAPPVAAGKVGEITSKQVRFDIYNPLHR